MWLQDSFIGRNLVIVFPWVAIGGMFWLAARDDILYVHVPNGDPTKFTLLNDVSNSVILPYIFVLAYYGNLWYEPYLDRALGGLYRYAGIIPMSRQHPRLDVALRALVILACCASFAGLFFSVRLADNTQAFWYHHASALTLGWNRVVVVLAWASAGCLIIRTLRGTYYLHLTLKTMLDQARLIRSITDEGLDVMHRCSYLILAHVSVAAFYAIGATAFIVSDYDTWSRFSIPATFSALSTPTLILCCTAVAYLAPQVTLGMTYTRFKSESRQAQFHALHETFPQALTGSDSTQVCAEYKTRRDDIEAAFREPLPAQLNKMAMIAVTVIVPLAALTLQIAQIAD